MRADSKDMKVWLKKALIESYYLYQQKSIIRTPN